MLELFLIFLIFLIILLIIYYLSNNHESFENKNIDNDKSENKANKIDNKKTECNDFFERNSYCELDIDKKTCNCKLQKDDLKYLFDSPENCCKRDCMKLSPEECIEKNNFTNIPYYCNIGGTCKEFTGTIVESHIATNNCGIDPLNNQLLLPFATIDECSKNIDPCDKYNLPNRSMHINQAECIKDVNCGYCTNSIGGGKCISGTAEGPDNFHKYFFCNPEIRNTDNQDNRYIYGDHAEYLLQSPPKI